MPGVPSSRRCDACRLQKKKCVAASSSCDRCRRLSIACTGLGQLRFRFVEQRTTDLAPLRKVSSQPVRLLSNEQTQLLDAFVSLVDPDIDIKVNVFYNFGGFMASIPRRIGHNKALDAAADAFIHAFLRFSEGRRVHPDALRKHGQALLALRGALSQTITAQEPETLCAIQVIMAYQVILSSNSHSCSTQPCVTSCKLGNTHIDS